MKFKKDRSVKTAYFCIPLIYTGIIHRNNPKKELCLMESLGKNYYSACYRNNYTNKVGIYFLLKKTSKGFIFRGKEIQLKNIKKSWVF